MNDDLNDEIYDEEFIEIIKNNMKFVNNYNYTLLDEEYDLDDIDYDDCEKSEDLNSYDDIDENNNDDELDENEIFLKYEFDYIHKRDYNNTFKKLQVATVFEALKYIQLVEHYVGKNKYTSKEYYEDYMLYRKYLETNPKIELPIDYDVNRSKETIYYKIDTKDDEDDILINYGVINNVNTYNEMVYLM